MSILILLDTFLPHEGGSINWMVNTYSRWSMDQIIFVVPQCEGAQDVDSSLPFTVLRLPMDFSSWDPTLPKTFLTYMRLAFRIQQICREYQVSQIHCAKVLPEGLLAWWVCQMQAIPYLLYAHGEEILFTQTSRKYSWLLPKLYNKASAIISNSHNTQTLLTNIGVAPQHIHVIHPGVDAKSFECPAERRQGIQEQYGLGQSKVLLTVGRLQRRKGQDMVIRALPEICQQFPDVKYLIVGQGEDLGFLQQLADKVGVGTSVVFAGRVSSQELPALYSVCDIFVMPNRQIGGDIEGFGMVFLEANAAGKPVIGGISGGTNEAIADGITGLRVDGESIDQIAGAILKLLSHPEEAQKMGMDGRKRIVQECSWESVVERTLQVVSPIHQKDHKEESL